MCQSPLATRPDRERADWIKYFGGDPGPTTKENRLQRKLMLHSFRYSVPGRFVVEEIDTEGN